MIAIWLRLKFASLFKKAMIFSLLLIGIALTGFQASRALHSFLVRFENGPLYELVAFSVATVGLVLVLGFHVKGPRHRSARELVAPRNGSIHALDGIFIDGLLQGLSRQPPEGPGRASE